MTLYRDENHLILLQPNDDVQVPDFIYVFVDLDVDSSTTRLIVQVEKLS